MSIDILVKIEDMCLDDGLYLAKSGRVGDGRNGVINLGGVIEGDVGDIGAEFGNDLVGGMDVGRGKAECVAATGTLNDVVIKRVGFAEHRIGFINVAVLQGCADAA